MYKALWFFLQKYHFQLKHDFENNLLLMSNALKDLKPS